MGSLRNYIISALTVVAVGAFGSYDYEDDAVPCKEAYLSKYVDLLAEENDAFLNMNFTHDVNVVTPECQSGYYQGSAETMPSLTCQYVLGQGYASGPDVMSYLGELKDRCVKDDGSDKYILTFGYSSSLPIERVDITTAAATDNPAAAAAASDITATSMDGYYIPGAGYGDYVTAAGMVSETEALGILRADYTFYLNVYDYSIRQGPSTSMGSYHSAAVLVDGTGLVCGGYTNGIHATACQMLWNGAWSETSYRYTVGRSLAIMTGFNDGTVIATGGSTNGIDTVATAVALHPDGTNTDLPSMNVARFLHAQTKLNDNELIACGGYSYDAVGGFVTACEVYNRAYNTWTVSASLNTGRYGLQILNFNGDLFVLGGGTQTTAIGLTVERLKAGGTSWEVQQSTLKHRRTYGASVVVR